MSVHSDKHEYRNNRKDRSVGEAQEGPGGEEPSASCTNSLRFEVVKLSHKIFHLLPFTSFFFFFYLSLLSLLLLF